MNYDVLFLSFQGGSLSAPVRRQLYEKSWSLHRSGRSHSSFRTGECEGVVTTNGSRGMMGTYTGILFRAEFEEGNRPKRTATFIVRDEVFAAPLFPGEVGQEEATSQTF